MDEILDHQPIAPLKKIFSGQTAYWATMLGGPLVMCYFLWHNYRVFGNPKRAAFSWLWVIPCFAASYFLPEMFPIINKVPVAMPLAMASIGSMAVTAGQAAEIKNHLDMGGKYQPWWVALAITLASLVVTVSMMGLAIYLTAPEEFEQLRAMFPF